MTLKYFLSGLMVLLSQVAYAQNIFQARIVDHESQNPLVGVTVYFPSLDIGNVTDTNGEVTINNIPSGQHPVKISFVGYESSMIKLTFITHIWKWRNLSLPLPGAAAR